MSEPRIFLSYEHKMPGGDKVTVGLSQVPWDASENLLDAMLETVDMGAAKLRDAVRAKIAGIRREPKAFDETPKPADVVVLELAKPSEPAQTVRADIFDDDEPYTGPLTVATQSGPPLEIPEDVVVPKAFGVQLPPMPEEWAEESLSGADDNSGQLLALNAALSAQGYKNGLRHRASQEIINSYRESIGLEPRESIGSLKDLTKAEANVVLTFLDKADNVSHEELARAVYREHPMLLALSGVSPSPQPGPGLVEQINALDGEEPDVLEIEPESQGTFQLSDDQAAAVALVKEAARDDEGRFIFITGKAGTGKSTVLRQLRESTKMVVLAPTGLAAVNVGGQTIHSFFGFKTGPLTRKMAKAARRDKEILLRSRPLIVIDEVSMVRADLMDAIDASLQKTLRSSKPFGGLTVIAFGDMWQLEPVVTEDCRDWIERRYGSPFWFDAHVFTKPEQQGTLGEGLDEEPAKKVEIEKVELGQVFRQLGQPDFVDALNLVRTGDGAGLDYINSRAGHHADAEAIALTFTNKKADAINAAKLAALPGESRIYHADISGDFEAKDCPAPLELELKVGARVMVCKNVTVDFALIACNGATGTVTELGDYGPTVELDNGTVHRFTAESWDKVDYGFNVETDDVVENVKGSIAQIPLKLAWAITVHKSQGQTLESAVLELESQSRTHGQVYVALSRVKSEAGLFLRRRLGADDLVIHPRVREFAGVARSKEAFA